MDFMELAAARYSVRAFSDRPIEAEKEARILDAGMLAPTAVNRQPQRVYVLKSPEALEKVNQLSPCIYGAPEVLLICYNEEEVWKSPLEVGYNSGEVDAAIVGTHMMLQAWQEGIGSCWVRFFHAEKVRDAFSLPEHIHPVALMPIGYAAAHAEPAPMHALCRPRGEVVQEL